MEPRLDTSITTSSCSTISNENLDLYRDDLNELHPPPIEQGEVLEETGFFEKENDLLLAFHITDYTKIWKEPFNPNKGVVNIKEHFLKPFYGLLKDIASDFGIEGTSPSDLVDALCNEGCFITESRNLLMECILGLNQFEENQEYSCEPDLRFLTLTSGQKELLGKTYWLVLHPLYHFLTTHFMQQRLSEFNFFFRDIDLIRIAFESKFPQLPIPLVKHIALHHCQTKVSLETHLRYFKALSTQTKESFRECYFSILEKNLPQEDAPETIQMLLNVPNKSGLRLDFGRNLKKLEIGLNEMTTKLHDNGQTVSVTLPSSSLPRYLKPSLLNQFGEGKSYSLRHDGHDFQCKDMPYHPLMEYAIHNLTSRIAGKITPANLLARFDVYSSEGKKSHPVLITETIQGKSFSDEWHNILPGQSYTWNLLCSILTRPGDGRLSSFRVDNRQNLFGIDHEYSFVELIEQGKIQFCSALFSALPLETPLDQEVLKDFAALDIEAILLAWIDDVIAKEKEYKALFPKGIEGEFTPTILLPEGAVATLYLQLWSLQNAIQQALDTKERVVAGDLLNELISLTDESIGITIHKAYDTYHTVSDAKERLKKATLRETEEPLSSAQYCHLLKIEPSIEKIEKQKCYSPVEAKKEILIVLEKENSTVLCDQPERKKIVEVVLAEKSKRSAKKASLEEANCKSILSLAESQALTIKDLKEMEPKVLLQTMKYCVRVSENEEMKEDEKNSIQCFFALFIQAIRNEDINERHPIKNSFYKKMLEGGYRPKQLFGGKWNLQKILSQELTSTMAQIEAEIDALDPKSKKELLLKRDYYRGVLAGDLCGNRYKPAGGGVNGAVFFRHLESGVKQPNFLLFDETTYRPFLGVFKPHPITVRKFKGLLDLTQWKERMKSVAGMDANLNKKDPDCRVNNEIFAYELFHIFGFDAYVGFPTTIKVTNKNDKSDRPASFCNFIPGFDVVKQHIKILNEKDRQFIPQELHLWAMSKIGDYLPGNMDGHDENAFVKIDEHGRLIAVVNFDYDKAFAIQLTPWIDNQYKWVNLEISKRTFPDETKLALQAIFMHPDTEARIQTFLNKAREGGEKNFTQDQEILLRNRIEVIKKIVTGEVQQLADIKARG